MQSTPGPLFRNLYALFLSFALLGGCSSELTHSALPTANFGGAFTAVAGTAHAFDGSLSTDDQGEPLTYTWNFGDGSTAAGVHPLHTYATIGSVVASLTVSDGNGLSSTVTAIGSIAPGSPAANAGAPYAGTVGTAVNFSGLASTDPQCEPLTYAWDFGDGSTATGASPAHIYAKPGTYSVGLSVTDTSNVSATAVARATIAPARPVANAGMSYLGVAGTALTFNGSGSSDPQGEPLTYAWNFGDGETATGMSPAHVYSFPGMYTVSLGVTDTSNLSATVYSQATIAAAVPMANAGGPYTASAGPAISFNGDSSKDLQGEPLTYAWSFGDTTTGSGVSPSHTYWIPGTYAVSVTVTNTNHLSSAATSSAVVTAPPSPTENRVLAALRPIANSSVQLYAAGSGTSSIPLLETPVITDQNGAFSIANLYTCPSPDSQIYIAATGGDPGLGAGTNNSIALMAALGSCSSFSAGSPFITINATSTVAAIWPASPYMLSVSQIGNTDLRTLSNAFVESANLAGIAYGTPPYSGIVLANQDLAIRSLANSLEACVESSGDITAGTPCSQLFTAATSPGGATPTDTVAAALAISRNPGSNVALLYQLGASNSPFQPALVASPSDWSLGLVSPATQSYSIGLNNGTVFMGDSITQYWPLPVHNAGIAGQHASEMLTRFSADVLGHGYARVVILAGTNDVWMPTPASSQALQQVESMAETARAAGIEVVLCEIPPMLNDLNYEPYIRSFNAGVADFAMTNGYLLVDFYSPMATHPEYFLDGVHPNAAGYAVMEAALSSVAEQ